MENASKALIMAGGILIALMILGALMLMFGNLSSYQKQNDETKKDSQIAEFNNQFVPYDKDNITLMELKTLYNKIESNNSKNPEFSIKNNIKEVYPNIDKNFKDEDMIPETDKINRRFKCKGVNYDFSTGRVNEMNFERTK